MKLVVVPTPALNTSTFFYVHTNEETCHDSAIGPDKYTHLTFNK